MSSTSASGNPSLWAAAAIPSWTRASAGSRTPSGSVAVFASPPQARFGLRLAHLADELGWEVARVAEVEASYRDAWERYTANGRGLQHLIALQYDDLEWAVEFWNGLDHGEIIRAVEITTGELDVAGVEFADRPSPSSVPLLAPADDQAAWEASPEGRCQGCGMFTISRRQHDRLLVSLPADGRFLLPTAGSDPPPWTRLVLAATGAAVEGASGPVNVCAACRPGAASLDELRTAAFAR